MFIRKALCIGAISLALTGCISFQAPSYTSAPESLAALKQAHSTYNVALISTAANDDGAITCRGAGPVTVGKGKTYADYVVDALAQDLKKTNTYSPQAPETIKATYTKIDFQSSLGAANWYINGVYTIGAETATVDTTYNDRSSFAGDTACNNMARYFPKAVAAHLNQLYNTHLFKNPQATAESSKLSLTEKLAELKRALDAGLIQPDEFEAKRKAVLADY